MEGSLHMTTAGRPACLILMALTLEGEAPWQRARPAQPQPPEQPKEANETGEVQRRQYVDQEALCRAVDDADTGGRGLAEAQEQKQSTSIRCNGMRQ